MLPSMKTMHKELKKLWSMYKFADDKQERNDCNNTFIFSQKSRAKLNQLRPFNLHWWLGCNNCFYESFGFVNRNLAIYENSFFDTGFFASIYKPNYIFLSADIWIQFKNTCNFIAQIYVFSSKTVLFLW
jgi:hypothetical protein